MATSDDEGHVLADYAAAPRRVELRIKLNIRDGASRTAAIRRKVAPPLTLFVDRLIEGENYLGNRNWYREANSNCYFWAGGVEMPLHAPSAPTFQTPLRNDGTILPLTITEVERIFNGFTFVEGGGGLVTITTPNWEADNLVAFSHALLSAVPCPNLRVHKKALPSFQAAFDAIRAANLGHLILECAGTFVARHKGNDPGRELSPHSWGIAIDLNTRFNPYRCEPCAPGTPGSVHELVPFFATQGFAWGGHFSPRFRDGMHFELARRDI